ncbi:FadR/GntR family transcriptional regulator [Insolitispirillum peregrinum]|uniref:FadR/GntR family transcriptional regulator n=1 Tax=Insolitispirillum peregrinum TaxID=80876 RepID=UPI0036206653
MTRQTSSIPDYAAKQIQTMIQSGEFPPGSALPAQRELAERLGVSRASLREALIALETLGMVRVQAGKGVFVLDGPEDPRAIPAAALHGGTAGAAYQFRLAIEPFVAGLAAQYASAPQLAALAESVNQMRQALTAGDLVDAARTDFDFHQSLLVASGNPLFVEALRPASATLQESRMLPFANRARLFEPLLEHEAILDHIRRRNPSGAHDAMHRHVLGAARRAGVTFLRP